MKAQFSVLEPASTCAHRGCRCGSACEVRSRAGAEGTSARAGQPDRAAIWPLVHDGATSSGRATPDLAGAERIVPRHDDLSGVRSHSGEQKRPLAGGLSTRAGTGGWHSTQFQAPSGGGTVPAPASTGLGAGSVSATVSGLNFTATGTFSPCTDCSDGLEVIQVAWATGGTKVGTAETVFPPLAATYYTFVDGGSRSPGGAVYSGNHPYYIGRPGLPRSYGYIGGQGSAGSVSGCIARPSDTPTAVTAYKEAYFETVFVCLNYNGSGKDKLMNSVQWGFENLGAKQKANPRTNATGPLVQPAASSDFEATLKADYPSYSHS